MASILVAYASKHGATEAIAERIAEKLAASGLDVEIRPARMVPELSGYDAFVIGGATYMGSWLKDATELVRRNQDYLATQPVWLFASGPLGTEPKDAQGRDLLEVSEPKEFAELKETIKPRGTCIFFGVLKPNTLGFSERMVRRLPAGRTLLPEGDFRDWQAIDAWARSIARQIGATEEVGALSR